MQRQPKNAMKYQLEWSAPRSAAAKNCSLFWVTLYKSTKKAYLGQLAHIYIYAQKSSRASLRHQTLGLNSSLHRRWESKPIFSQRTALVTIKAVSSYCSKNWIRCSIHCCTYLNNDIAKLRFPVPSDALHVHYIWCTACALYPKHALKANRLMC